MTDQISRINIPALCNELCEKHHAYVRQNGPRLLQEIGAIYKQQPSEALQALGRCFQTLLQELEQHMQQEESTFFPQCEQLASGQKPGSLFLSMRMLGSEHAMSQAHVASLEQHARTYARIASPEGQTWLEKLQDFCSDLKTHIHKEEHLLFPEVLALESRSR